MSLITGGLIMLSEMVDKLPPSERKIAIYIMDHPEEAINCTANELGIRSSTSGAAVIRLCKSLGLKGFQELKLKVAGDLNKAPTEGYRDITPQESHSSIIEKMTNNSMQSLKETAGIISQEELERAVNVIKRAEKLHFFGVGASAIIAQDAQQKFLRINKQATSFTDVHMAAMIIGNVSPSDVVFGISFSGETLEVTKILELSKQNDATTISLTSYGASTVSEISDIRLHTSASKEATFRSGATSSRLAQLHIIDIVFMCVAADNYERTIHYLKQTRDAIEFLKG